MTEKKLHVMFYVYLNLKTRTEAMEIALFRYKETSFRTASLSKTGSSPQERMFQNKVVFNRLSFRLKNLKV